jgi:hypothetical protein
MPIENENQYQVTHRQVLTFKNVLAAMKKKLAEATIMLQAQIDGLESQIDEMEHDMTVYRDQHPAEE